MKLYIQILSLAVMTFSQIANSYELEVKCDSRGNVLSQVMKSSQMSSIHEREITSVTDNINFFNKVLNECSTNTKSTPPANPYDGIALVSENNSRARTWSTRKQNPSTYFDRKKVKDIIRLAIKADIDPYAALALAIMEDPPYANSSGGHMGSTINQASAAEAFGCRVAKNPKEFGSRNQLSDEEFKKFQFFHKIEHQCRENKPGACEDYKNLERELSELAVTNKVKFHEIACFSDPGCAGLAIPPDVEVKIDLTNSAQDTTVTKNICLGSSLAKSSAFFISVAGGASDQCCVEAKFSRSSLPKEQLALNNEVNSQVSSYVFLQMIKNQIQNKKQEPPPNLGPAAKVAWLLQAYNGRGVLPKSSGSLCLSGVDMGRTPVYGATGGDVMMNMLMLSPEVANMVERSRVECATQVKSIFCAGENQGTHRVNSQDFPNLEKSYLSSSQNQFKICSKGKPELSFKPWTEEEAKIYFGD